MKIINLKVFHISTWVEVSTYLIILFALAHVIILLGVSSVLILSIIHFVLQNKNPELSNVTKINSAPVDSKL